MYLERLAAWTYAQITSVQVETSWIESDPSQWDLGVCKQRLPEHQQIALPVFLTLGLSGFSNVTRTENEIFSKFRLLDQLYLSGDSAAGSEPQRLHLAA